MTMKKYVPPDPDADGDTDTDTDSQSDSDTDTDSTPTDPNQLPANVHRVIDNLDGSYRLEYFITEVGTYDISLEINGDSANLVTA
jgi:hypothetical protein